jgi:Flp pilus assembly protein TadG
MGKGAANRSTYAEVPFWSWTAIFWKVTKQVKRNNPAGLPGQSLVEFAIVSVILLMLSIGIVDFGRLVYQRSALTNAAREAARVGAIEMAAAASDTSNTSRATKVAAVTTDMQTAAQNRSPALGPISIAADCYDWGSNTPYVPSPSNSPFTCNTTSVQPNTTRLTVTATFQFSLIAGKFLKIPDFTVKEYADVAIQ